MKNRYVVIYNEPNHGQEWGNSVDARSYARVLNQTIDALKQKSEDFFVLNAGFDASTPEERPSYQDQLTFMREMNDEVPDIFNKLDGWASHSYPNPGFLGSPLDFGRRSIRGYLWELEVLKNLGVSKNLPVFITETGWKHSDGKNFNPRYPSPETIAGYYKYAFENVWSDYRIVAVTPFLLNYQDYPFDHFSFKKIRGASSTQVLGAEYPEFHPHYITLASLNKPNGKPRMRRSAQLTDGSVYHSIVANEEYTIPLTFKNVGQSIWNNDDPVRLIAIEGGKELGVEDVEIPKAFRIEPGKEFTFNIRLKAPSNGAYKLVLNLFDGNDQFDTEAFEFETQVKSPVSLKIKSKLKWKDSAAGDYFLKLYTVLGDQIQKITLNDSGQSQPLEAKFLLPDYTFEYTLEKDYYKPKTIRQTVQSGENILDFGTLEPDFLSTIFNLKAFWGLLPLSKQI